MHIAVIDHANLGRVVELVNGAVILSDLHDRLVLGERGFQGAFQLVVKDRAHNRDTKHLTETTDELNRGGDDSHVLWLDSGLHSQGRGLHGETHTETAEQQDEDGDDTVGILGEQDAKGSTDGEEEVSKSGEEMVRTTLEDPDTGGDGGDDDTNHKGHRLQTSNGRRLVLDDLEVDGEVKQDTKEGHAREEQASVGSPEVADLVQMNGDDGLLGDLPFGQDKDDGHGETAAQHANDDTRVPGVLVATPAQGQQDHDDGSEEKEGTEEIDTLDLVREGTLGSRQVQVEVDEEDRDGAKGQVDPERPAPGNVVGESTTHQRADD